MALCLIHRHVPRAFCETGSEKDLPAWHLSGWKKLLSSALVKHSYFGKWGVGCNGLHCCDRAARAGTVACGSCGIEGVSSGRGHRQTQAPGRASRTARRPWRNAITIACSLTSSINASLQAPNTIIPSLPWSSPYRAALQEAISPDKLPGSQIRPALVLEKLASPADSPLSQHQLWGLA